MLLILALLYWFNKYLKRRLELGEVLNRIVVGVTLIVVGVVLVMTNKTTSGFKFQASHWIIPIVAIMFAGGEYTFNAALTSIQLS